MSDRELLELAAKAADIKVEWREWRTARKAGFGLIKHTKHEGFWIGGQQWNPLTDDGDALRLAVKLKMDFNIEFDRIDASAEGGDATEYLYEKPQPTDPYAATRRAIVRAAAEIGRSMP